MKPSHCVMLCDLVSRKNNKLAILQIFLESVLTNDLSCLKFHELQGKCLCYGQIHGIVCLNEPILCTIYVFMWQTMLPKTVFNFIARKSHFPFSECQNGSFFVKHVSRIRFKMVPHYFSKILDHILSTIHEPVESKSFLASSRKKDKFLPI